VFQNVDGDEQLVFSESGIPKEPVGFSDNPTLILGYPKLKSIRVSLLEANDSLLSIKMNYRRKR